MRTYESPDFMGKGVPTGLKNPEGDSDAVNRGWLLTQLRELPGKASVLVAAPGNLSIAAPGASIDGITPPNGSRILLPAQSTASQNGIYIYNGAGVPLTRALDFDNWSEIVGASVYVQSGSKAGAVFNTLVAAGGTIDSTNITFLHASGAGAYTAANGVTLASGQFSLTGNALALHNLSANGFVARTGSGALSARSLSAPAAGFTISNPDGVAGNPTFSLSDDLAAVEALSTTGIVKRTGANTWSAGALVASDLPSGVVTAGTYRSVTVDTYGRVTAGANPTNLAGYGITDAVSTSGDQTIGGNKTFSGTTTFNGNVVIAGTTTTVDSVNLEVTDPIITVGKNNSGGALPYMGIKAERGSSDFFLVFNETDDIWEVVSSSDDLTNTSLVDFRARQLRSSVPTGTAPLVVASSTQVPNLNADLLDGQHGAYYRSYLNLTDLPTTLAGYGITDALAKSGGTLTNYLVLHADATSPMHPVTKQQMEAAISAASAGSSAPGTWATITHNGSQTIFDVTHAFNTKDVFVTVRESATDEICLVGIKALNNTTVRITFGSPEANGTQFRVGIRN